MKRLSADDARKLYAAITADAFRLDPVTALVAITNAIANKVAYVSAVTSKQALEPNKWDTISFGLELVVQAEDPPDEAAPGITTGLPERLVEDLKCLTPRGPNKILRKRIKRKRKFAFRQKDHRRESR